MDPISIAQFNLRFLHMKAFYKVVKHEDLVFAQSPDVSLGANRFQKVYNETCQILGVKPLKQVGRSSFRAKKQREIASEIAKYWIEDKNPCKHYVI